MQWESTLSVSFFLSLESVGFSMLHSQTQQWKALLESKIGPCRTFGQKQITLGARWPLHSCKTILESWHSALIRREEHQELWSVPVQSPKTSVYEVLSLYYYMLKAWLLCEILQPEGPCHTGGPGAMLGRVKPAHCGIATLMGLHGPEDKSWHQLWSAKL